MPDEVGDDKNLGGSGLQVIEDITCPVCGCLCDDLRVTLQGQQLQAIEGACSLAKPWYEAVCRASATTHEVTGIPASLDEAVGKAIALLRKSRAPLIYGLSRSSTDGQRKAIELAEMLGATIDTTASVCHGPSIMAIQQVGESTSSLGEVRQRSDLVVYWGCDPVRSHPRHLERYSAEPLSEFLPGGRADRTIVVIDTQETETSQLADVFLRVSPDRDYELICEVRSLLSSFRLGDGPDPIPVSPEAERLFQLLSTCRYGAVFFGLGIAQGRLGHQTVAVLLRLVAEMNAITRMIARRMRIPGDVAGADSVLCWQTGFPFAVNLGRGYPRYNPGEFSANELLERGEVDCCLFVGSESISEFSTAARAAICHLPVVTLESAHVLPEVRPDVLFRTAVYGVHCRGTGYRMDEIPISMRPFLPGNLPTDAVVIEKLAERLRDS